MLSHCQTKYFGYYYFENNNYYYTSYLIPGSTPLHLCCFHGKRECVEKLLQYPEIDINCRDMFNRTP